MNKTIPLSELFHVASRFHRSVHLERDFYTGNVLDGYVLTVTARETLRRVIAALDHESTSKAWTLTGPYGSGKSAFALFIAKLLDDSESPTTQGALNLLKRGDKSLWHQFSCLNLHERRGFCPVLISGERSPITLALLRGLKRGLIAFSDSPVGCSVIPRASFRPLLLDIQKRLDAAENGVLPHASEITDLFESATYQIGAEGGTGLLLVVDELGKFLEYAAQNPAHGDLFVLQSLAEYASRSDQTPLLMLTILHQAFEQYAQRLATSQREEWAKVQGRFEDVAFVEPTEQVLRLIGDAIEKTSAVEKPNLSVAVDLELKPRHLDTSEFMSLLENCLPSIDGCPDCQCAFPSIRSKTNALFSPYSTPASRTDSRFLFNQTYDGRVLPTFTLSSLYDYIHTALGSSLYTSREGVKVAEIESAIERLPNPSPMTVKLIKTIGLLGIVGEGSVNLKASKALLRYALNDDTETFQNEVDEPVALNPDTVGVESFKSALAMLEQRSIAITPLITMLTPYGREAISTSKGGSVRQRTPRPESAIADCPLDADATQSLIARRHLFVTGTVATLRCPIHRP